MIISHSLFIFCIILHTFNYRFYLNSRCLQVQHFYVFHFNKKNQFILIGILAFFTAVILFFNQTSLYNMFIDDQEASIMRGNTKTKRVALTFNISWGEEKVFDILDTLKDHKVKATFFVSGEWAERHPQILEAIVEQRHELGMLGYRYQNYLDHDIVQIKKDLLYARTIFKKLGYDNINYVRTPSGYFNEEMITLAEDLGFQVIHWSVNPNDWKNPGVNEISNFVMEHTSNGDIVLLHASDSAKQTAKALKKVIPSLQKKKLSFVSISELLSDVTIDEKLVD